MAASSFLIPPLSKENLKKMEEMLKCSQVLLISQIPAQQESSPPPAKSNPGYKWSLHLIDLYHVYDRDDKICHWFPNYVLQ